MKSEVKNYIYIFKNTDSDMQCRQQGKERWNKLQGMANRYEKVRNQMKEMK